MESLTNPIGLRRFGFGTSVVDVFNGQIQLIFMMLDIAAD
jgi:hypothetical protein